MKNFSRRYFKFVLIYVGIIFSLLLVQWEGAGAFPKQSIAEAANPAIGFTKDNPGIRKAIEVQKRHEARLMGIPGVMGVGTGIGANGQPVIRVFTMRAGIPNIPQKLEEIPVETKVTGMFVAYSDPTDRFARPVPVGVSTGHPDITAGTIGCRVTGDLDSDGITEVYALSNNHVYANQNDANFGDSALQPGDFDGGVNPIDKIGELYDFEPIDFSLFGSNTMDAAIALSSPSDVGCSTPQDDGYGTPNSGTRAAEIGLAVQKYGRTTKLTHGQISEISVFVAVCYANCNDPFDSKYAWFDDQITIISSTGAFSLGGDSGSLIVTDDVNKIPVGLLFAGSNTHTLANRIDLVLGRFDVTVDDCSSTSTNDPPFADFSFTTSGLTVNFEDQSTDSDGSVEVWGWNFGDDNISAQQHPSHTYKSASTYTVTLTITDNDGATDSVVQDVTVTNGSNIITLTAIGYPVVRNRKMVGLEWSGATSTKVDIYRNDSKIGTTKNDGFYTDRISLKDGSGPYVYQVCEQGSISICSNDVSVAF